ncbi:uncharacterized protein LOC132616122 isoform X2 [Lycium barbarum]|uniref:uncharacterized protein LOC132616122 isoform X2 n=1 Tax=Lycium barbarum TaxID=112863 RepID=UPI00293EEAA3|nr:uncharacterized protein LOC132616122 isoform X2 [Lycium barbarum]
MKQIMKSDPALARACGRTDLIIGSGRRNCSCQASRKKFKRFKLPQVSGDRSRFRKRTKYVRRRPSDARRNRACFIYYKIGYFARNCPQSKKSMNLFSEIADYTSVHFSEDDDLESVFSIEDSKPQVKEEINSITVIPQVEIKVYASKWDKPTHVTAFFDIGAASSLINPAVSPDEYWVPYFKNSSNGILTITVITKHLITIEFFLGLKHRTKLIGSDVPGSGRQTGGPVQ